jgi:hypothetical protein
MKTLLLCIALSGCALDMNGTEFWAPPQADAGEASALVADPPAVDAAPSPPDAPAAVVIDAGASTLSQPASDGCPPPFMVNPSLGGPPCIL